MKVTLIQIQEFLKQGKYALAGASRLERKMGNSIYKEFKNKGVDIVPINPNIEELYGDKCYKSVADLPSDINALIICTKPADAEKIVQEAVNKGIKNIWLQQGAQSEKSIEIARQNNINLITKKCVFMFFEPVDSVHKFHRSVKKLFGTYPK
jgi:predicted CoA-binding protein